MITSGYVSRIPIVEFSQDLKLKLAQIAQEVILKKIDPSGISKEVEKIDVLIFDYLGFTENDISFIKGFSNNLLQRV
jgi:hypothetical protein